MQASALTISATETWLTVHVNQRHLLIVKVLIFRFNIKSYSLYAKTVQIGKFCIKCCFAFFIYICAWQNASSNKWHPQQTVPLVCRWLRPSVNQVSVALIVSAYACMQGVQGSNPTDD